MINDTMKAVINRALGTLGYQIVRRDTVARFTQAPHAPEMASLLDRIQQFVRRNAVGPSGNTRYAYLGNGVGIALTHDDHRIFIYTGDFALSPHLALFGEWERAIETVVRRLTVKGGTAIEVGSNLGYHTLAIAQGIGPAGRLFAFEANPELYRLLYWTLRMNDYHGRVTLYNKAALSQAGKIEFQFNPDDIGSGNVVVSGDRDQRCKAITVEAVALDECLPDLGGVSLIRMDCEGSEPLVLRGARAIISRSPDLRIISEWSVPMMRARVPISEYIDELVNQGFKFWKIDHDASLVPVSSGDLLNLPHCDVVMSRRDPAI